MSRLALLLCCACLASACAPPKTSYEADDRSMNLSQPVVYQGSTGSLSYAAPTGKDVRVATKAVRVGGEACQWGVQIPLDPVLRAAATGAPGFSPSAGWGDGGYRRAIADAASKAPGARLHDVRVDLGVLVVLGVVRRECVRVDAAAD